MRKFISIILSYYFIANLFAQGPQYYNYNTPGSTNSFPFNVTTGKAAQWLIRAGELNHPSFIPSGKSITTLYFYIGETSSRFFWHLTVKLGQTTMLSIPAGKIYDGPLTTVYYRTNNTLTTLNSIWLRINLDIPFPYDTSSSLVVDVSQCASNGDQMYIHQTNLTGLRRCWADYSCPNIYRGQDSNIVHLGVDVVSTSECIYYWNSQNSNTTSTLYTVKAVDSLVGWAAGENATIRRTTNGGITWIDGNPNQGIIVGHTFAIDALNADTALCASTNSGVAYLYRTTNGGVNWSQLIMQAGGFINSIHFISEMHCYAFGNPVGGYWSIWHSGNGGLTWSTAQDFPQIDSESGWNNSLFFDGIYVWFGTNHSRIYRTENPGCNWKSASTSGLTNSMSLHFNSNTLGLAGGEFMLRTTNGGLIWLSIGAVPGSGNIYGIEGVGTHFWYIRGNNIYRSTNSGDNWFLNYSATNSLRHIDFSNINGCIKGWAVGADGIIVRMSTDSLEGLVNNHNQTPYAYKLEQNYPNPFNPTTSIKFSLPNPSKGGAQEVKIFLYDILGREVTTLVNEKLAPGQYEVSWNASNYPSGVYFYSLLAGDYSETKKMILVK